MSVDIVTFLRARLDEDEQAARAADSGRWLPEDKGISFEFYADEFPDGEAQARLVADTRANQWHIASWGPTRVLAEVDAKRRMLDWLVETARVVDQDGYNLDPEHAIQLLALPHADHPDYRDEWRPDLS